MLSNHTCISLDPAMFPDLDYARLKRSIEYFVEHYGPAEPITSESQPANFVERFEWSRTSQAWRNRAIWIADFVESTRDFCAERVAEIDRDPCKRNA